MWTLVWSSFKCAILDTEEIESAAKQGHLTPSKYRVHERPISSRVSKSFAGVGLRLTTQICAMTIDCKEQAP